MRVSNHVQNKGTQRQVRIYGNIKHNNTPTIITIIIIMVIIIIIGIIITIIIIII